MRRKLELSVEDGCILWEHEQLFHLQADPRYYLRPGISRMRALACSYVWWPRLDTDVKKIVKGCQQHQLDQSAPAAAPLHP